MTDYDLGQAVVLLHRSEKQAAATLSYGLKGRLVLSKSGWLLLEVPNDLGNGAFKALAEPGIEQPTRSSGVYNAHISVANPTELAAAGITTPKECGQQFSFTLGAVKEITNPTGWADVSKCWVIQVRSPELLKLRRSMGLGEPRYPFHITFAIRRKNALRKQSSIIHGMTKEARSVAIRKSPIHGKGIFATRAIADGETIIDRFMYKAPSTDDRDRWEQSEDARYTNHSHKPNIELVPGDEYAKLVATRDIVPGEELVIDYADTTRRLGNFYYTYQNKDYGNGNSASSSSSLYDATHPTSRAILVTIRNLQEKEAVNRNQIQAARDATQAPKSEAQADAGNYPKGKIRMHGMEIALENPKGSTRSGTAPDGKKWSVKMKSDYGYIKRTEGKDGDHIDVFLGDTPEAELVYVVDQQDPATKKFDEHKVMMGFLTEKDAREAYFANYEDGWQGLSAITPMTMTQFKWWLDNGDTHKPVKGVNIKQAVDSFYLNAIKQTPMSWDQQKGIAANLMAHLGRVRTRGDRAINESAAYDRLQNAADPSRASRQFMSYLNGQRPGLVSHPLDRFLHG